MNWLSELVDRFVLDADDRAIATGLLTRAAGSGPDAATALLEACRLVGEAAAADAELRDVIDLRRSGPTVDQIGLLVIACFSVVRAEYAARPDAQAAREWLSALADETVDLAGQAFGSEVMEWLSRLVGEAVSQVSAVAATRSPLVRVETRMPLPSSLIAFDLYGQPERGEELTARARSGTPLVMPAAFEALAP